jgi:heat shock protein HspQ
MKSFLGDYVRTKNHGHRGRVVAIHTSFFRTGENKQWLDGQEIPVTEEERLGKWYSILCIDGGSVLVSESDIVEKENPYPLNNVWESEYFNQVAV